MGGCGWSMGEYRGSWEGVGVHGHLNPYLHGTSLANAGFSFFVEGGGSLSPQHPPGLVWAAAPLLPPTPQAP